MTEQWRTIAKFEDAYLVSDLGNVFSVKTERVLKPVWVGAKRKQYAVVRLSTNPRVDKKIHQLVLEAFVGPRPDGCVACHKNDDSSDNRLSNLEWGTRKHNAVTAARNVKFSRQKLSAQECKEIAKLRMAGVSGKDLAVRFNISPQRVCDIYKKRSALA